MGGRNKLLFSFIILKNALLKKKIAITIPEGSLDIELLKIFRSAGLVTNFYSIKGGSIKVIFYYSFGKPIWKIKTFLNKGYISKTKVRGPLYKKEMLKGGLYLIRTPRGLVLGNIGTTVKDYGNVICVFFR